MGFVSVLGMDGFSSFRKDTSVPGAKANRFAFLSGRGIRGEVKDKKNRGFPVPVRNIFLKNFCGSLFCRTFAIRKKV